MRQNFYAPIVALNEDALSSVLVHQGVASVPVRMLRARYLLRFDDVCPTSNWTILAEVESILAPLSIRPIVAVVPDNRDPELWVHEPYPSFWQKIRHWQALGWSIGLHGYQHLLSTGTGGLLDLNRRGEFGGALASEQERRITSALAIFGENGVRPDVWVAPAHSFDATTLEVLRRHSLLTLSDGFFLYPGTDDTGVLWVPQQLWDFRPRPFGVWTVCFHANGWGEEDVSRFRHNVAKYDRTIVALQHVEEQYRSRRRRRWDVAFAGAYRRVQRIKASLGAT